MIRQPRHVVAEPFSTLIDDRNPVFHEFVFFQVTLTRGAGVASAGADGVPVATSASTTATGRKRRDSDGRDKTVLLGSGTTPTPCRTGRHEVCSPLSTTDARPSVRFGPSVRSVPSVRSGGRRRRPVQEREPVPVPQEARRRVDADPVTPDHRRCVHRPHAEVGER